LVRPEKVHYVSTHACVHPGLRKVVATTQRQKARFKFGAGVIRHPTRTDIETQELGLT
jgi:hypothetical protein